MVRNATSSTTMIFADTHILLWLASADQRLPKTALERLISEEQLIVSAVTAWEYADLQQRGRFGEAPPFAQIESDLTLAVVDFPAAAWPLASQLPQIHRDPIDRMLVAHAIFENCEIATADSNIRRYPVKTLW
jgi:PIN domain nuclease of toxin-antitoxin system